MEIKISSILIPIPQHHSLTMDGTFQPHFLSNSPNAICDQILYLVNNSNLNFELNKTHFSLNLRLKKSFAQLWKKPDYFTQNTFLSQTRPSNKPVHQLLNQPSVCQPSQSTESAPRQFQGEQQIPKLVPGPFICPAPIQGFRIEYSPVFCIHKCFIRIFLNTWVWRKVYWGNDGGDSKLYI